MLDETPRKFRLDDGSMVESITVNVEEEEYTGTMTVRRVDRRKSAFEVEFRDRYHRDTSLFGHGQVSQMRIHARFALEKLVRAWLAESGNSGG